MAPTPSTSGDPINLQALYADPDQLERLVHDAIEKEESIPANLQVKETIGKYYGLMKPSSVALEHEAAPLLKGFAENGCPVDCRENWSEERIVDAMPCYEAHTSPPTSMALLASFKRKPKKRFRMVLPE